jgi:hypothetical protein
MFLSYPPIIATVVNEFQYTIVTKMLEYLPQLVSNVMIRWKLF